jgi:hypothetical protein
LACICRLAPSCLPISAIEGDGINDEENGNRRRYGEQRSHVQKSTFNYWMNDLTPSAGAAARDRKSREMLETWFASLMVSGELMRRDRKSQ